MKILETLHINLKANLRQFLVHLLKEDRNKVDLNEKMFKSNNYLLYY